MFKRIARSMVAVVAAVIATGLMSSPAPSHAQPPEADDKERSFVNSDGWTIEEARRLSSAQPGVQYVFSFPTSKGLTVTVGVVESGTVDVRAELLQNLADLATSEEGESVAEFVEAQVKARKSEPRVVKIVVPADASVSKALAPYEE